MIKMWTLRVLERQELGIIAQHINLKALLPDAFMATATGLDIIVGFERVQEQENRHFNESKIR